MDRAASSAVFTPMIERLIRIGVALAVAVAFTGRMEAATAHCARLVAEEQAVSEHAQHQATPCHGMDEAVPAPPELASKKSSSPARSGSRPV